jgi:hypothetical protein
MPRGERIPAIDVDRIFEMAERGLSDVAIGKAIGRHRNTVAGVLRNPIVELSEAEIDALTNLIKAGKSVADTARILNRPPAAVFQHASRLELLKPRAVSMQLELGAKLYVALERAAKRRQMMAGEFILELLDGLLLRGSVSPDKVLSGRNITMHAGCGANGSKQGVALAI